MKRLLTFAGIAAAGLLFSSHYCSRLDPKYLNLEGVQRYKTEHVVILVIDGPRFVDTYGSDQADRIPYLKDSLMQQGVFMDHFYNRGSTFTVSGHASITTGRYQRLKNNGLEYPTCDGIFNWALKQNKMLKEETWLIASKGKLNVLATNRKKDIQAEFIPNTFCGIDGKDVGYAKDLQTMNKVHEVMDRDAPKLMLINLLDVDVAGHANDWDKYIKGIQTTDSLAYVIWKKIQSNPKMKDKTTLFITNDHGRHKDGHKQGFKEHGDKCSGCKHISLLAIGPDFKKGVTLSEKAEMIDIAPTAAELLGIKPGKIKGEVLFDLFR